MFLASCPQNQHPQISSASNASYVLDCYTGPPAKCMNISVFSGWIAHLPPVGSSRIIRNLRLNGSQQPLTAAQPVAAEPLLGAFIPALGHDLNLAMFGAFQCQNILLILIVSSKSSHLQYIKRYLKISANFVGQIA